MIAQDKSPIITLRKNATLQLANDDNVCNYFAFHTGENSDIQLCLNSTNSRAYMTQIGAAGAAVQTDIYDNPNLPTCQVYFKPIKVKFFFKNNYAFGTKIDIWKIHPKVNHDATILNKIQAWFRRMTPNNSSELVSNVQMYPQMIPEFKREFKILQHKRFNLGPGQEAAWITYGKAFHWSNAQTLEWNPPSYDRQKVTIFLMRIQGTVSHDETNNTLIGFGKSQCDLVYEENYRFQISRAAPFLPITQVIQGLSTMTDSEQRSIDTEESKTL